MNSKWMSGAVLPAVIVDLTNKERGHGELGTLKHSSVLDAAAKLKADDMAQNEYFAHYSPKGISPWHWFGEVKYNFVHAGENLAIHFTDSADIMQAWMDSPTHRANIMNGNYTEIGVGTAEGTFEGFKTVYVVQLFGTPAAPVVSKLKPVVAGASTDAETKPQTVQKKTETKVLAEAVSIRESVVTEKAKPVPVEVKEVVVEKEKPVIATSTEPEKTSAENMQITNTGVAMYSDFVSTSTGGIPATIDANTHSKAETTPFFFTLATQPHKILQILYLLIGGFVFCSLLLSIFIEIRQQQPLQIAYGVGLLSLMCMLFYIHTILSSGVGTV